MRYVLHCDLNNFYASVECLLDETLVGKPVVVCGRVEDRHGIVLLPFQTVPPEISAATTPDASNSPDRGPWRGSLSKGHRNLSS